MSNTTEKKEKQNFGQFIKFALFSASAGIIQVLTFTLLSEVVVKLPAIQSAMESNATFAKIMQNEYGPMYLTALILSVVWNFTFNRKFTFKSAANVPVAMLKVFAFYLVFTPISTLLGNYFTAKFADVSAFNYIGNTYAGGNNVLLNTVLRDEWGFKGFVLTDYFGGYGYQNGD